MSDKTESSTKAEELAKLLDGLETRAFEAVVAGLQNRAADEGLVIVFGASDDRMELRGAIDDEIGAWNGGSAFIFDGKLLVNECDEGASCPYFRAIQAKAFKVEALWCEEADLPPSFAWTYRLAVEHSTFTIFEDGEPWCRGVVFSLADITATEETGS